MEQIGILGGTFDPIHLGHLIPAQYACNFLKLDRLLLVPSGAPVHRPRHMPAAGGHRLAMCRLAAASLPGFEASDIEVARVEPSFTVLTLRDLAAKYASAARLVLLIGEDNLPAFHTWRDVGEILRLADVAVLPRPLDEPLDLASVSESLGRDTVQAILARRVPSPLVPISGTQIRGLVRGGRDISGLVPASVARYIAAEGLYRE